MALVKGTKLLALLVFQQLVALPSHAECPPLNGPIDQHEFEHLRVPAFDTKLATQAFLDQGFTCSAFDERTGITCVAKAGLLPGYSEEVAVIIPAHYVPAERPDLFMHVHGDNKEAPPFKNFLGKYKFENMLATSGRNSIMIVPYSRGASTQTNHLDLHSSAKFRQFMGSLTQTIQKAKLATKFATPSKIAVSGHSGGYNPIAEMLAHECNDVQEPCYRDLLKEVTLLDGAYAHYDRFAKFAKRAPDVRFVSYSSKGGDTVNGTKTIKQMVSGKPSVGSKEPELLPGDTDDATLENTNPAFVESNSGHLTVVGDLLPKVLRSK